MAATPARIGFITQQYRVSTSGPDATVLAKYGSQARDVTDPVETLLDAEADVQAICDERFALLKADRRRFQMQLAGESFGTGLAYSQTTPAVTLIDAERAANFAAAIVEIGIDFENNQTNLAIWG